MRWKGGACGLGLLEWSERVSRVVQGRPRLEVENGRLVIEQHKSVRAYSSTCIRVDCPGGEVCIEGQQLTLEALSRAELSVQGTIISVTWKDW